MEANIFHDKPVLGLIYTVGAIGMAKASTMLDHHIPVMIMDLFQIAAWCSAVVVATISVHGWIKKNFVK